MAIHSCPGLPEDSLLVLAEPVVVKPGRLSTEARTSHAGDTLCYFQGWFRIDPPPPPGIVIHNLA